MGFSWLVSEKLLSSNERVNARCTLFKDILRAAYYHEQNLLARRKSLHRIRNSSFHYSLIFLLVFVLFTIHPESKKKSIDRTKRAKDKEINPSNSNVLFNCLS